MKELLRYWINMCSFPTEPVVEPGVAIIFTNGCTRKFECNDELIDNFIAWYKEVSPQKWTFMSKTNIQFFVDRNAISHVEIYR